jgi:RecQ-mediated genome instability protein 1
LTSVSSSYESQPAFFKSFYSQIFTAESPYEQWRRLHNIELDDVKENRENKVFQSKKKRVFKLELTDGFKTIYAMEYSIISCLNTKLSPGCKVQIVGPLQVVNHILLLESKNIKILGGDVESLAITNAYENVLLRALKKPETNEPIRDYKEPPAIQETSFKQDASYQAMPPKKLKKEEEEVLNGIKFDDDDDDFDMVDLERIAQDEDKFRTSQEGDGIMEVVDDIIEIPDVQSTSRRPVIQKRVVAQNYSSRLNDVGEAMNFVDEIIEIPDVQTTTRRPTQQQSQVVAEIDLSEINDLGDFDYEIPRRSYDIDTPPKKMPKLDVPKKKATIIDEEYEFKTTCNLNIVTIDQYLSMKLGDRTTQDFAIFGNVSEFQTRSLKVLDNKWHVEVELSDDYSNNVLPASIHNSIIEKLTNYSARDMKGLYEQVRTRPQIKEDIAKIINKLYEKLVSEDRFFRIHFQHNLTEKQSIVQVIEFIETNQQNQQAFKLKIQEEKLIKVIVNPSDEESE